jgi:hypothetical protein
MTRCRRSISSAGSEDGMKLLHAEMTGVRVTSRTFFQSIPQYQDMSVCTDMGSSTGIPDGPFWYW